jgi:cellulose biosynthesis protein BcsQ
MIYALVNSKGGVSKTTTAVQLATMLARETSTLLIDGDSQASAATWAYWRRECNVEELTREALEESIRTGVRVTQEGIVEAILEERYKDR